MDWFDREAVPSEFNPLPWDNDYEPPARYGELPGEQSGSGNGEGPYYGDEEE